MKPNARLFSILLGTMVLLTVPGSALGEDFYFKGPRKDGHSSKDYKLLSDVSSRFHPILGFAIYVCEVRGGRRGQSHLIHGAASFSATRKRTGKRKGRRKGRSRLYTVNDGGKLVSWRGRDLIIEVPQNYNCFVSLKVGHKGGQ